MWSFLPSNLRRSCEIVKFTAQNNKKEQKKLKLCHGRFHPITFDFFESLKSPAYGTIVTIYDYTQSYLIGYVERLRKVCRNAINVDTVKSSRAILPYRVVVFVSNISRNLSCLFGEDER